ncbi:hypothetical protein H6F38_00450 [Paenibacillus sp. EKM208P]|nr:hypothetical protein H6F38_00450 [Paenibacillus sp. EKM208P]
MSIIRIYLEADSIVSGNIVITTSIDVTPVVNRYTAIVVLASSTSVNNVTVTTTISD